MNEQYFTSLNGYIVKDPKSIHTYNTISDMKSDMKLKDGTHVKTKGYYSINDGGNAEYVIVDDETLVDDGGSIHVLNNGLRAKLLNNDVNPEMFGAKGNGTDDDSTAIQNALNHCKGQLNFNGSKSYNITQTVNIPSNTELNGNNCIIKMGGDSEVFNIDGKSNISFHDFIVQNGIYNDETNADVFISTTRPTTNYCYNIHIYNIKYENTDTLTNAPLCIIYVGNVYNLEINNCNLKGNTESYMRGIMVWSTEKIGDEYVYTKSAYINIHDNVIEGFYRNIESYGTSSNSNSGCRYEMIIANNHVKNAVDTGIYAYHGEKSMVKNNYINGCKYGCWCDNGLLFDGNYIINGEVGMWTEEFVSGNIVNNAFESLTDSGIIIGGGSLTSNINSNTFKLCENCITIDEQYTPNTYFSGNLNINGNKFNSTYNQVLYLKYATYSITFTNNYVQVWGLGKDTAIDCITVNRNLGGRLTINNNVFENAAYTNAQPNTIGNCDNVLNTGNYQPTSVFFNNNIILGTMNYLAHIKIGQHLFFLNNIFQTPATGTLVTSSDGFARKYVIANNMNLEGSNTLADRSGGTVQ